MPNLPHNFFKFKTLKNDFWKIIWFCFCKENKSSHPWIFLPFKEKHKMWGKKSISDKKLRKGKLANCRWQIWKKKSHLFSSFLPLSKEFPLNIEIPCSNSITVTVDDVAVFLKSYIWRYSWKNGIIAWIHCGTWKSHKVMHFFLKQIRSFNH